MQSELRAIRVEVDQVCSNWAWHQCTLSISPAFTSSSDVRQIDMPKLDTYNGARNTIIVDNFLFGLDQYFNTIGIRDEASKLSTTLTFL